MNMLGGVLFVAWLMIGCVFSIFLLDEPESIPNPNKYKLAVVISGPLGWLIFTIVFITKTVTPIFKSVCEWFSEK